MVISIRESDAGDLAAIEEVRRASWRAAYAGIIEQADIERATAVPSRLSRPAPWRRTLVAVTGEERAVVGYASFGPERSVAGPTAYAHPPTGARPSAVAQLRRTARPPDGPPLTPAGLAGQIGEVYALYVTPDWWSTGTGRSLMGAALAGLEAGGYQRAVLWVLAANNRARRFYERAGFTTDGESNILAGLGGVLEVRYARPLAAIL
jgi:ribosomal protein S18 acetylase RimI-like enzyme